MNINTFGPPLAKNTKLLENGDNKTKVKPRTFKDSISLLTPASVLLILPREAAKPGEIP